MKAKLIVLSALATVAISSCNNEVENCATNANVSPIITTNMDAVSRATDGFVEKTQFTDNDKMGLFLYKGSWGTPYTGDNNINNLATYNGSSWDLAGKMYLNADQGSLWAYYPYDADVTDGTKIPVDITSNSTDYMYGTAKKEVSVTYPYATIDMHHALSQFVIRLKYNDQYSLPGKVSKVELKATNSIFYQKGEMNVSTGVITGASGENKLALTWSPENTQLVKNEESDYKALVLPTTFNADIVTLTVTIDNADYTYTFPQTTWEKGKRYIYAFEMTANELVIQPDPDDESGEYGQGGVKIEDWQPGQENDIELTPVN